MKESDFTLVTGGGLAVADSLEPGSRRLIGLEIDKYRIVDVVAEGGMGVVCRAEHTDESIDRTVALKISLASFLSSKHDERFQAEKAILSDLKHPNISHFYDAGVSAEGWPYFVMELVEGQHADDWASTQPLTLVVEKFIDVCEAVAFAHARLVIHRDIKPSNVLVDTQGQVKLVDFGIAKILSETQDGKATTQALSPSYASPEQLRADTLTTATDIYQLGGLLRHLLARLPAVALKQAIDRAVRGQDVQLERAERAALGRELSAIIERCMRDDPEQRYASVEALISDLKAWQGGYPVDAVSQATTYRVARFMRRHALGVTVFYAVLVLTATLVAIALHEGRRAEQALVQAETARDTAQQVTRFMTEIFERADPVNENPDDISARDLLDQGYQAARDELADRPRVLAQVLTSVGRSYYGLGLYEDYQRISRDVLAAVRDGYDEQDPEVGRALLNYANGVFSLHQKDSYEQAEPLYEEAIRYLRALDPVPHELLGAALTGYGGLMLETSRTTQARENYALAIEEWRKMEEPNYTRIATGHQNVALSWLFETDATEADIAQAATAFEEARSILEARGIDNRNLRALVSLNLGASYLLLNRPAEARAQLESAHAIIMELMPQHIRAVVATRMLGNAAVIDGRFADAEAHFQEALRVADTVQGGARTIAYGVITSYLAELRTLQGRDDEAAELYDQAFEYFGSPTEPAEAMDWINNRVEWYPLERLTPQG